MYEWRGSGTVGPSALLPISWLLKDEHLTGRLALFTVLLAAGFLEREPFRLQTLLFLLPPLPLLLPF